MNPFHIAPTDGTPEVIMDAANGQFEIARSSLPENATEFYNPVIQWLQKYAYHPNKLTYFHFKLEYFNTDSAKQILKLLICLEEAAKTSKVKIFWHYDKRDKDMRSSGERYSKLLKLPFEFVENFQNL